MQVARPRKASRMWGDVGFDDLVKEIVHRAEGLPAGVPATRLDPLEIGRSVRDVAASLGIAESCLHRWKSRDLFDRGLKSPSPEQAESAALAAARGADRAAGDRGQDPAEGSCRSREGGAPKSPVRPRR
jgi:hypothetical protein